MLPTSDKKKKGYEMKHDKFLNHSNYSLTMFLYAHKTKNYT